MKRYQNCEVQIVVLEEEDVVKTSQQQGQSQNVSLDHFNDANWWTTGGNS